MQNTTTLYKKAKIQRDDQYITLQRWTIQLNDDYSGIIRISGRITVDPDTEEVIDTGKMITTITQYKRGKVSTDVFRKNTIRKYDTIIQRKRQQQFVDTIHDAIHAQKQLMPMLVTKMTSKIASRLDLSTLDIQEKIDGHRAFYIVKGKSIELISKSGKRSNLTSKYVDKELGIIRKRIGHDYVLDSEIFNKDLDFNILSGLIARKTHTDDDIRKIRVKCFDIVLLDALSEPWSKRKRRLHRLSRLKLKYISIVKVLPHKVSTFDELHELTRKLYDDGMEGVVLRDPDYPYEFGIRSKAIYKYKVYQEEDFTIVGYTFSDKRPDAVIWICELDNGKTFKVQPTGSIASRNEIGRMLKSDENAFKNIYMNKRLQTIYYDKTSFGVPKFAKGVRIKLDTD